MTTVQSSHSGTSAIVPGRLRNFVEMTIQTRQAQRLLQGRRGGGEGKPPIIGLYRFGAMLRTIYTGSARNDPYADWYLLQVEQALNESKEEIAALRQSVDESLARVAAMDVGLAHSLEPAKAELTFSNPYGYMGGWLLVDFDELVLAVLTARHVGLATREGSERLLQEAGRAVRRAFAAGQGYKTTAATRDDIRQGTRRAVRATEAMGELPQAVIDGDLRPAHAPAIEGVQQPTAQGGHTVASDGETTNSAADADTNKGETDDGESL